MCPLPCQLLAARVFKDQQKSRTPSPFLVIGTYRGDGGDSPNGIYYAILASWGRNRKSVLAGNTFQEEMAGMAERAGFTSEDDVVRYIKELRAGYGLFVRDPYGCRGKLHIAGM
jgi:hypothetical protein